MRVEKDGKLQVRHCNITGNIATKGDGGVFWIGERSILLLLWCILSNNKAKGYVTFGLRVMIRVLRTAKYFAGSHLQRVA